MMVNREVLNYFKEGIELGHSLDDLKKSLVNAGWSEEVVDEARSAYVLKMKVAKDSSRIPVLNKIRPIKISILSVIYFLVAVWWIISFVYIEVTFGSFLKGQVGLVNIFIIILSLLPIFIGIGIWRGKNSWRITGIIFSFVLMGIGILSLFSFNVLGILNFILSLYAIIELLFDNSVKKYFY